MIKIAFLDMPLWQQEYVKTTLDNTKYTSYFFEENQFTDQIISVIKDCEIISVFVHTKTQEDVLCKLTNLKLLITRSAGFDHIDCNYCNHRCIEFKSVPDYGSNTIAQHAFSLILGLSINLNTITNRTKESNFNYLDKLGIDLKGKTLGVLGAGRIGRQIMQIAKGFEMNLIAFDLFENQPEAEKLGYTYNSIDYVLQNSDVISLHLPLTPETKVLLSLQNLRKIKKGAILINTARGDLLENEDIITFLDEGIISGLGLDCIKGEKEMFKGIVTNEQKNILERENVLFTPHNAYYTKEAVTRILDTTIDYINKFEC